ncbi:tRNA-uridine aminocarboxypropyltransferase [Marinomonas ostreistagni]
MCPRCDYPEKQCVCRLIPLVEGDITVWILQDKTEAKHAKNSARLFRLCYAKTHIVSFSDNDALTSFFRKVRGDNTVLLYPSDVSEPIETCDTDKIGSISNIVLLDGTWPKAKKMYLVEPRLQTLKTVNFQSPPRSHYEIRKSPNANALSTLEAAAYGLECLGNLRMSSVRHFFHEVIKMQWSQQPDSHKHRI